MEAVVATSEEVAMTLLFVSTVSANDPHFEDASEPSHGRG